MTLQEKLQNIMQQAVDNCEVAGVNLLVENTKRIDYEWLVPGSAVIEDTIMNEAYATGYGQKTSQEAGADAYKTILDSVNNSK